jgi:hypothetical protein
MGRKHRKQFVSSVVKLDKLSLRDAVFNVVVVLDIRDYTQTQLNINNPCAVWLAAMLNYVPAPSTSAVFVCMRICLFLITVSNHWPSSVAWLAFLFHIWKVPVSNQCTQIVF